MTNERLNLLLVEDDDVAAESVLRAARQTQAPHDITRVKDGVEALEALRGAGGRARVAEPRLVLLDLRMPRMNGLQFLDAIRDDPELSSSVVFVLTTSNALRDREEAYRRHVAGYISKSRLRIDLTDLFALLGAYADVVQLPPSPGRGIA